MNSTMSAVPVITLVSAPAGFCRLAGRYCQILWMGVELGGGLVEAESVLEDDSSDDVG